MKTEDKVGWASLVVILALIIGGFAVKACIHDDWRCAFAQCRIEKQ